MGEVAGAGSVKRWLESVLEDVGAGVGGGGLIYSDDMGGCG